MNSTPKITRSGRAATPTLLSIPNDSPRARKYGTKFDPVTIDNITNNSKSVEVNLIATTLHMKSSPTLSIKESSKAPFLKSYCLFLLKVHLNRLWRYQ